ncbi:hypothetical protein PORY_001846 [Pneumocystis oryctolagi]|uniref:Uncharacterized protein n=1 Tax=Pneumocystis oryctolagi TaxID=42067 RepID=A0ACB7CCX6_9ASCO|nr:hypothetical protein PORY_001846 [Pneumocystis oryctolagi]
MPSQSCTQQPLFRRVQNLIKHPQFVWFIGHTAILFFSIRYLLFYVTFSSVHHLFCYRAAFMGAILTYGIVVYKTYAKTYSQEKINFNVLMRIWMDENVQYLFLAILWFVSRPIAVSLIPYMIFSLFHFLTYFRSNVLHMLNPNVVKPDEKCIEAVIYRYIQHLTKLYYGSAMKHVSKIEVILIGTRVLVGAFTFQNSFTILMFYSFFIRYRYFTSTYTRQTFLYITIHIDHLIADSRVPPSVRNLWMTIKRLLKDYAAKPIVNTPSETSSGKETFKQQ